MRVVASGHNLDMISYLALFLLQIYTFQIQIAFINICHNFLNNCVIVVILSFGKNVYLLEYKHNHVLYSFILLGRFTQ